VKSHNFDEPSISAMGEAAAGADPDVVFRKDLLELIPFLRAFSRSLCGDRELADDLAQEALAKAWQSRDTFRAGSNLKAWLFTILRNQFYSDRRRAWRQAPWDDTAAERVPVARGEQTWAFQLSDTARALRGLPAEQREALILVGAGGFSYEDAARISNCAVGTVKSRVARARKALSAALDGQAPLPGEPRRAGGDATNEIMEQLDHLAPFDTPEGNRPHDEGTSS
jgi:RNA polymerase sigma-70 factor (ECF subfamily)